MKNYLLFIIDSLNYSHVKESDIELMPFLRDLERDGLSCNNMYSQAPYTEAAVMDIYCGQNVLDHGGYFFRFKDTPLTIFEAMKDKGYTTFYNSYQPQCHPSSLRRGVDYLYYNVGYDQAALWSYRLSHFADLLKKNEMKDDDYNRLFELLDDNFNEWLHFIDDIENDDISVNMIKGNASAYNAKEIKEKVLNEKETFDNDKKSYIDELLNTGYGHRLFKIPAYNQDYKIKNRNFIIDTGKDLKPLMKKIKHMDFKLNTKNAFASIAKGPFNKLGSFIKNPGKGTAKDFAKAAYYSLNYLVDTDLNQRIASNYDSFKNAPSARTHIKHYIDWAIEHKNDEKPHFACVHIDDIHNPEIFFTYDSEDRDLINKEKQDAYDLLREIPNEYYGSLSHDLSLRYIDGVIKFLYDELEKNGMLDNTCIAICADHGFSFSGNPIRDSFVINLYLENYNIPFVVTGSDKKGRIDYFCSSKDIPETLCDLVDGKVPKEFTGRSILDKTNREIHNLEYCGGGCPDISRRQLKIAAFDDDYFVGTLCTIDEDIYKHITEIYDLKNDKGQKHNLVNKKYNKEKVDKLMSIIRQRREIIIKQI